MHSIAFYCLVVVKQFYYIIYQIIYIKNHLKSVDKPIFLTIWGFGA